MTKKLFPILLTILCTWVSIPAYAAEELLVEKGEYDLNDYAKEGSSHRCGLGFVFFAVDKNETAYALSGSINTLYDKPIPILVMKLHVSQLVGRKFEPRKVHWLLVEADGLTSEEMSVGTSGDGVSAYLGAELSTRLDLFTQLPHNFIKGARLSFSLGLGAGSYTVQLPPFTESDMQIRKRVAECDLRELDDLKAHTPRKE